MTDGNAGSPGENGGANSIASQQENLTRLGYYVGKIDGQWGAASKRAVRALKHDLLVNDGKPFREQDGQAPVKMTDYNRGRVTAVSDDLDQGVLGCIADMIADEAFVKMAKSPDPAADNQRVLSELAMMTKGSVPLPYMRAILRQESGAIHVRVDGYPVIGLDRNDASRPDRITSRGYGIGQYTFFHHPLTPQQYQNHVADASQALQRSVGELRSKFDNETLKADDRRAEHKLLPLRICKYSASDNRYMADCKACVAGAGRTIVKQGVPVYVGAGMSYQPTQYYPSADYGPVAERASIPCDWPYAIRRYNGNNVNSYHYQIIVLRNVEHDL